MREVSVCFSKLVFWTISRYTSLAQLPKRKIHIGIRRSAHRFEAQFSDTFQFSSGYPTTNGKSTSMEMWLPDWLLESCMYHRGWPMLVSQESLPSMECIHHSSLAPSTCSLAQEDTFPSVSFFKKTPKNISVFRCLRCCLHDGRCCETPTGSRCSIPSL